MQKVDVNDVLQEQYIYAPFGTLLSSLSSFAFSSEIYDVQTELSSYCFRPLILKIGRWIKRDPIEEVGGINLYSLIHNDSISFFDNYGLHKRCLDPKSQECQDLLQKIENIRKDIEHRIKELDENREKLPEHHPDDLLHSKLSREGHRRIIKFMQEIYEQRWNLYNDKCGPPPSDYAPQLEIAPQYLPTEAPHPNNMAGKYIVGGIVVGIEIYIGYRIIRLLPSFACPPTLIPNLLVP